MVPYRVHMKVTLVAAITADGYIGRNDSDLSLTWTSKEDKMFFRAISKEIGNLVVGSKTFATFDRKILGRKFYVYSSRATIENVHDNDVVLVQESPAEFVEKLAAQSVPGLLVAGGSSIYTQFMQAGVVDELYFTIEPVLFGKGVPLFNSEITAKITLIEVIRLSDQTNVFHYKVEK